MSETLNQQAQESLIYLLLNSARHTKGRLRSRIEATAGTKKNIPFELLSHLDFNGNTLIELARRLRCSKQEITRQVQQAEANGWIITRPDTQDKRAKRVLFAPSGQQLLADGFALYDDFEQELTKTMGTEQVDQLKSLLREFNQALQQPSEEQ